MDKKLFKNYIYNILYQLVKLFLPLFLVSYTYSHLGPSTLGINDYAANISSWFILLGVLGVNTYGNREIAKVRDDKDRLSKNFYEILVMQIINMSIALLLYVIYTVLFVKQNQIIYFLICLSILASVFDISWFYYGVEDFGIVSIRNIVVKIVSVLLIFTFVKKPADLWMFTLINSLSDLVGQLVTFLGLKKYIDKTKVSVKEAYKNHLAGTFALFIPTLAINIYTLLDQTLLGTMVEDKAQLSLYKTSVSFVKMFLYFVTSIGAVVMPRIANIFVKNKDHSEVNKYINMTFRLAIILSIPIFVALEVVSGSFFPWYTKDEYMYVIPLVRIVSPIIIFISLSNVFGTQYLVPTGRNSEYTKSIIAGALVNLIINLYAIPRWQAAGACVASVCAEFTVTFTQWLYIRKDVEIHSMSSFIKSLISAIVMGVAVYFVGEYMGARIITNLVQAIIGILVYVMAMFILKEDTIVNLCNKYVLKKDEAH